MRALETALSVAMKAAIPNATNKYDPESSKAGCQATKTPVPTMAETPTTIAENSVRVRIGTLCVSGA
jgi:hypothetical protein